LLAADRPLPQCYFDRPFSGEWSGFRDCHIRPDLVLIYEKSTHTRCVWSALARIVSSGSDVGEINEAGLQFVWPTMGAEAHLTAHAGVVARM
jgi:hypothetical protein